MPLPERVPFNTLSFSIVGYCGPNHWLELKDGVLHYFYGEPSPPPEAERIDPTLRKWANFEKKVIEIGVWNWQPRYPNEIGMTDGTQWSLELTTSERIIRTSGDNAFPGEQVIDFKQDVYESAGASDFDLFLRALKNLTGKSIR